MNKKYIVVLLVILLVASGGFMISQSNEKTENNQMDTNESQVDLEDKNDMMHSDAMEEKSLEQNHVDDKTMDQAEASEKMMDHTQKNEGNLAPDFTLETLKGESVVLSELQGQKVYLKFWASWCSICLAGMEELDQLAETEDFVVYTIVAPGEKGEKNKEAFIKWFEGLGYENIEVLLDLNGDIQDAYGVRAFPTSAYIGSDGVLIHVLPGHVSNDKVESTFMTIH
jgi:thiol-disulfide isomerase/thioredoxin